MRGPIVACCLAALVAAAPAQLDSGLDLASFDRSIRPQDDLFRFVNGGWIARTPMPGERVVYTAAIEVQEKVETDLRAIIEELAASRPGKDSPAQQIVDLYASIVDISRLEALGRRPLEPELNRIDAVRTASELAAVAGHLSASTTAGPFFCTVALNPQTNERIVHLAQGGTLLPDREYYLSLAGEFPARRRQYRDYLANIFTLMRRPTADADADAVLTLEIELARAQWTQTESRDPGRTFNLYTIGKLTSEMPGFDWRAWARPQGIDRAPTIVVAQPSFFRHFALMVSEVPLSTWKAWLAARYITATAPYADDALNMARFEFFGRELTGQQDPRVRWKRGVSLVSSYLGDELGRRYVDRHFPAGSRRRVQRIVDHLLHAWRLAVRDATWLSGGARIEAFDKLTRLSSKIGYPDRWRSYRGLAIDPADLMGNVARAQRFENQYRMARVGQPDDRGDWLMTPQTVNAYYSPSANEIVFPAAILQPPFFNPAADDAVNYGAIGAVIGHEIGHALDDRGRRHDGTGAARDWWSRQDELAYRQRVAPLVEQYFGYSPQPSPRVNGTLTLAENVGDLTGLAVAYRAYLLALDGRSSREIDGFTGEQRFFLGWARIWRTKEREEYQRQMLLNSPYAPNEYRANGPVGHLDGFHRAFEVKPGDRLYRDPVTRVRIW